MNFLGGNFSWKKIAQASPFLLLFALSLAALFHFSSVLRSYYPAPPEKPGGAAFYYTTAVKVYCPPTAYELETVRLMIVVHYRSGAMRPWRFSIETPSEIEVQGTNQRAVSASESWWLLPKEQGEYVVVVRGQGEDGPHTFEQHLSVRKFDDLTRRQFVFGATVGAIIGVIGIIAPWFKGLIKALKNH